MSLNYDAKWKYGDSDISLSTESYRAFNSLITRVVSSVEHPKGACEILKIAFGDMSASSDESWAKSDLDRAMAARQDNAPLYLESLYNGLDALGEHEQVPGVDTINEILRKHQEPFRIEPPELLYLQGDATISDEVPEVSGSETHDRYERVREIGHGGFGTVYHVRRKTSLSSFDFAMKVLDPSSFSNRVKAEKRFRREIDSLKKLQHRAIVQILESGILGDGTPYYVMPLVGGTDFRKATEGGTPDRILRLFLDVLEGVEYAHSRSVLHRDLKPTNIIVRNSDQQAMVLDFGAAFLLDDFEGDTLTTENIGTLGYIPPEVQANPKLRSPTHDVYSCGVLLYEAFARCLPNSQDYSPLVSIDESLSSVDAVVQAALSPTARRLPSIHVFRERIEGAIANFG